MTNFENKKDECMKILAGNMALVDGKPVLCEYTNCYNCDFYEIESGCDEQAMDWLLSEYQEPVPKLTRQEREFLECFLNTSKRTISRDLTSGLLGFGYSGNCYDRLKEDIFQFIKKGECWFFDDLLKLEVEE
mgnify:CR=1 FL=1